MGSDDPQRCGPTADHLRGQDRASDGDAEDEEAEGLVGGHARVAEVLCRTDQAADSEHDGARGDSLVFVQEHRA